MTAAKAKIAVVEIGADAVRLLVGQHAGHRKERGGRGDRDYRARNLVRHLDSRVRPIYGDDAPVLTQPDPELAAVSTLAVVTRFLKVADRAGATPVLVARPDLLAGAEGPAIVSLLAAEVPEPVRRLSPTLATALAFNAVRAALDEEASQLVVGVSGASTDVIVTAGTEIGEIRSIAAGIASLAAGLPDPPTPLEWALEAARLGAMLASLPEATPMYAYAFGDGADIVAGFDAVRGDKRPFPVSVADLDRLSDELLRSSTRKVARRTGAEPWRIAETAPAALIVAAILQRYGLERCVVLPQGLRDGIVLAAAVDPDGWWEPRTVVAPAAAEPAADEATEPDEPAGAAAEVATTREAARGEGRPAETARGVAPDQKPDKDTRSAEPPQARASGPDAAASARAFDGVS